MNFDLYKFLCAIAEVESGNDDTKIGPCGERSQFQIKEAVWGKYNPGIPFEKCKGQRAWLTASEHVVLLQRQITDKENILSLAYCWRGGYWSYHHGPLNDTYIDYSTRVKNIYTELLNPPPRARTKSLPQN